MDDEAVLRLWVIITVGLVAFACAIVFGIGWAHSQGPPIAQAKASAAVCTHAKNPLTCALGSEALQFCHDDQGDIYYGVNNDSSMEVLCINDVLRDLETTHG